MRQKNRTGVGGRAVSYTSFDLVPSPRPTGLLTYEEMCMARSAARSSFPTVHVLSVRRGNGSLNGVGIFLARRGSPTRPDAGRTSNPSTFLTPKLPLPPELLSFAFTVAAVRTFLGRCSKSLLACPVWKLSSKLPH